MSTTPEWNVFPSRLDFKCYNKLNKECTIRVSVVRLLEYSNVLCINSKQFLNISFRIILMGTEIISNIPIIHSR